MDFEYTPEQEAFRKELRGWLAANLPPDLCVDDPADDRVAPNRETFEQQLEDILLALESNVGVRLAPTIGEGVRVRIRDGPLQGIEGWVEKRYGMTTVLLRLDFISQAAAVKLEAHQLELI